MTPPASLSLLQFALFDDLNHGVSTRHGGVSPAPYRSLNLGFGTGDGEENVLENRRILTRRLGIAPGKLAAARLTHGRQVTVIRSDRTHEPALRTMRVRAGSAQSEPAFCSDGIVSDAEGLHFLLTAADCVPLVFADRRRSVVGAAHAGWRGTALGIARAIVEAMRAEFGSDPCDIVVALGPSIGPCCYEVKPEVPAAFRGAGLRPIMAAGDGLRLDLWESNELQLREAGVPANRIENPRICTSCNVQDFFSHRAEGGRTGRFALCIGLAPRSRMA